VEYYVISVPTIFSVLRSPSVLKIITYFARHINSFLGRHIHFGKEHVGGGIVVFFCVNAPRTPPPAPAAVPPACPSPSGTVSGTLHPADVVAVAAQNVPAGNFDAVVAALATNTAYVNVHTTTFPGGEIRGQIHLEDRDNHGKGNDHDNDKDDHH